MYKCDTLISGLLRVPDSFSNLTRLSRLGLSGNSVIVEILAVLGLLPHLKELYLDHNHLHGPIPSSFNNLTRLKRLEIQRNYISGEFPDLGSLRKLYFLDSSNNNVSSQVPSTFPLSLVELLMRNNILDNIDNIRVRESFVVVKKSKFCGGESPTFLRSEFTVLLICIVVVAGVGAQAPEAAPTKAPPAAATPATAPVSKPKTPAPTAAPTTSPPTSSPPAAAPAKSAAAPAPSKSAPASSAPAAAPAKSAAAPASSPLAATPESSPPAPVPVSSPPAKSPPAAAPTTPPESSTSPPAAAPTTAEVPAPAPSKSKSKKKSKKHNAPAPSPDLLGPPAPLPELPDLASTLSLQALPSLRMRYI
ncbi:Salt tolerance 2, putative isoform 1 [Hibiscus syriacus]|uniref:Salt tolerance 2, putative isoform 1 n=1 Tax=Hibiscus syriacus TaxID=106335 RepID=A0A6A2WPK6_HIBSY|nr:Salt tolerance 2, putative isoform 1 [Hibiscus syriacus]